MVLLGWFKTQKTLESLLDQTLCRIPMCSGFDPAEKDQKSEAIRLTGKRMEIRTQQEPMTNKPLCFLRPVAASTASDFW